MVKIKMCLVQFILQIFEKNLFFKIQQPIENRRKKSMAEKCHGNCSW
jgi:hypothetical protein